MTFNYFMHNYHSNGCKKFINSKVNSLGVLSNLYIRSDIIGHHVYPVVPRVEQQSAPEYHTAGLILTHVLI